MQARLDTPVCHVLVEGHDCSKDIRLCTLFYGIFQDHVDITVMEDHDVFASLDGCYGEMDRLIGRDFSTCLKTIDMGKMVSSTSNVNFLWCRHGIAIVVVFGGV